MSQTGYTPIQLYRTTTASAAPAAGNLADGELAINTNDGKLFYKDSVGNVQTLAAKATGTIGGSTTQVQYNSSGSLAGSSNFTFDGTNVQIGSQGDLRLGDADNSNWVAFQAPAVVGSNVTWTLPATDGSSGQVLSTNGSGTLSWATTVSTPGGSDTQIQYNSSNTFAGATGLTTDGSNLTVRGQGDVRFADSDSSNWVAFQAPATIASNITWTLPNADGTSGQFLSTDGTGTLSWATASGGGGGGVSVTRTQFTATAGQTTFTVSYTAGQLDVYLNGALLAAADYTATNGTSVVLTSGAALNDILTTVAYNSATQIIQGDTSVAVSDTGSNGTIVFKTDNVERARITNGGALLINTATNDNAANRLYTIGYQGYASSATDLASSATKASARICGSTDSSMSSFMGALANGNGQYIQVANTSGTASYALSLNPYGGNVGIGTGAPSTLLHLVSSAASYTPILTIDNTNTGAYGGRIEFKANYSGSGYTPASIAAYGGSSASDGRLAFETAGSERMRINNNGTLLINSTDTTPSGNNNIKLNAVGQQVLLGNTSTRGDTAKGVINLLPWAYGTNGSNSEAWADLGAGVFIDSQIESGNTALCNNSLLIRGQIGASSGPGCLIRAGTGGYNTNQWTQQFKVLYNGNVTNTNNSYGSLSDAREKQDIIDASNQWGDIKSLKIKKYRLIRDVERAKLTGIEAPYQIGVIAQELLETSPGLVEINGDENNMMSIKYSVLYMKAVKALQEAMARIEVLEADVAALKVK